MEMNEEHLHLPTGHRNSTLWLGELKRWTVSPSNMVSDVADITSILDTCLWGTEYSSQVFRWLQLLQFPLHPSDDDPGVSWCELAVSFMLTTQSGIVVNGASPGEAFRPKRLDVNDNDTSFGLMVYSFERVLSQVVRTLKIDNLPKRRRFCTSTKMLGLKNAQAGLQHRPVLPHQTILTTLLFEHFAAIGGSETNKGGPNIPEIEPLVMQQPKGKDPEDFLSAWTNRHKRYQIHKSTRG